MQRIQMTVILTLDCSGPGNAEDYCKAVLETLNTAPDKPFVEGDDGLEVYIECAGRVR